MAHGRYHDLIERTIAFLRDTPAEILRESHFDPDRMEELALDVRAHDHTHPVTKRTNYTFGEWDPHRIDTKGTYTRFVVRKIVLDALLDWIGRAKKLSLDERYYDAAAVLSGTMLMASSISGPVPRSHDSNVNLVSLLPKVARQRDAYYERPDDRSQGTRRTRLRQEAKVTQQPFGHIRQHLNIVLARHGAGTGAGPARFRNLRAARLSAGGPRTKRPGCRLPRPASRPRSNGVSSPPIAPSSAAKRGRHQLLDEIEDHLDRGIGCGALADPWNILGFQGMFPLFSSREDSVPDQHIAGTHRHYGGTVQRLFTALGEAAALADHGDGRPALLGVRTAGRLVGQIRGTTVEDVPKVSGRESFESAVRVAQTLRAWSEAGEAAGDISFWRTHVEQFESAQRVRARGRRAASSPGFRRRDGPVDPMAQRWRERGLESEGYSFHALLIRWIHGLLGAEAAAGTVVPTREDCWPAIRRLFDFLEANAGPYWTVPTLAEAQARHQAAHSRSRKRGRGGAERGRSGGRGRVRAGRPVTVPGRLRRRGLSRQHARRPRGRHARERSRPRNSRGRGPHPLLRSAVTIHQHAGPRLVDGRAAFRRATSLGQHGTAPEAPASVAATR